MLLCEKRCGSSLEKAIARKVIEMITQAKLISWDGKLKEGKYDRPE
jgi:hypothetical protein